MSEEERAIARSCLVQIATGMSEIREVSTWWFGLSESRRQEFKDFGASVEAYRREVLTSTETALCQ